MSCRPGLPGPCGWEPASLCLSPSFADGFAGMESVGKDPVPAGREGWLLTQGVSPGGRPGCPVPHLATMGRPGWSVSSPCRSRGSWPQPWGGTGPTGQVTASWDPAMTTRPLCPGEGLTVAPPGCTQCPAACTQASWPLKWKLYNCALVLLRPGWMWIQDSKRWPGFCS